MAKIPKVNVCKHKNGIYYLRYTYNGERRMVSTRTRDLGRAELERRKSEGALLNGLDPEIERERKIKEAEFLNVTLADLWPEIQQRHLRDKSPKTDELYCANFKNLSQCKLFIDGHERDKRSLVDIPLREFNKKLIELFKDLRLEQGRKPATVNRDLQFLRMALNLAVDWEYLDHNPIRRLKLLTEKNRRDVSNLNPSDLGSLLDKLPPVIADICEYSYYSWRRLEECLALRIEHVHRVDIPKPHYVARYLVKGGTWAEFPMSSMVLEISLRNKGIRESGYVFVCPNSGDRYKSIRRTLDRHVRSLGIRIATGEYFCFHDWRRLAATDASRRGHSQEEIAEGLGHSNSTVTSRYAPNRLVPLELFEGQSRIRKEEKGVKKEELPVKIGES